MLADIAIKTFLVTLVTSDHWPAGIQLLDNLDFERNVNLQNLLRQVIWIFQQNR